MATELLGRIISVVPVSGSLNLRDPKGSGVFDANDPGEIDFINESVQRDETAGVATFKVRRTGGSGVASIDFQTIDGTALDGTGYLSAAGTLEWDDGEFGEKTIEVELIDRSGQNQGDQHFYIELSNPFNATIRQSEGGSLLDTMTVTIRDLDGDPSQEDVEILWDGSFQDGTYDAYRINGSIATFHSGALEPEDHRVKSAFGPHGGDGRHMNLATPGGSFPYEDGPRRGPSAFSNRVTADNGAYAESLVWPSASDNNHNRGRVELNAMDAANANLCPKNFQTCWTSMSYFVPNDWDLTDYGQYLNIQQWKPRADRFPVFLMDLQEFWRIRVGWTNVYDPYSGDVSWPRFASYHPGTTGDYALDFPDGEASLAALQSVNRGGWTDWIMHVRFDPRSTDTQGDYFESGGEGFLDLWKREDDGPLIKVLEIRPRVVTVSGTTLSRGVGYPLSSNGYYRRTGYYGRMVSFIEPNPRREIWMANDRVYTENNSLEAIAAYIAGS